MENSKTIRSPFFYVGDKYKLMPQLKQLMPKNIEQYIEPFVGGGSSFLNSIGTSYMLNDVDSYVVELHRQIGSYTGKSEELFGALFEIIDRKFKNAGYNMPKLIFWNVNSRTKTIPVCENENGLILVSGFSINILKMVMSNKLDPYEALLETLNSERYARITYEVCTDHS